MYGYEYEAIPSTTTPQRWGASELTAPSGNKEIEWVHLLWYNGPLSFFQSEQSTCLLHVLPEWSCPYETRVDLRKIRPGHTTADCYSFQLDPTSLSVVTWPEMFTILITWPLRVHRACGTVYPRRLRKTGRALERRGGGGGDPKIPTGKISKPIADGRKGWNESSYVDAHVSLSLSLSLWLVFSQYIACCLTWTLNGKVIGYEHIICVLRHIYVLSSWSMFLLFVFVFKRLWTF